MDTQTAPYTNLECPWVGVNCLLVFQKWYSFLYPLFNPLKTSLKLKCIFTPTLTRKLSLIIGQLSTLLWQIRSTIKGMGVRGGAGRIHFFGMMPTNSTGEASFDNNQVRWAMMERYARFFKSRHDILQSVTTVYSLLPCVAEKWIWWRSKICVLDAMPPPLRK